MSHLIVNKRRCGNLTVLFGLAYPVFLLLLTI